jgi:hypothetical protein
MATQNVTHAAHGTLTASTVEIVNFSDPVYLVIVVNRGTTDLFFRLGSGGAAAVNPAVLGADSYIVPASQSLAISRPASQTVNQIKLISSGTPDYSVEGF